MTRSQTKSVSAPSLVEDSGASLAQHGGARSGATRAMSAEHCQLSMVTRQAA